VTDIEARLRKAIRDCTRIITIIRDEHGHLYDVQVIDEDALAAVVRGMVEANDVEFTRAIADVFDGMACDPHCDREGHAETCPATHGPSAVRSLRARLAEQTQEIERLRAAIHDVLRDSETSPGSPLVLRNDPRSSYAKLARALRATPEAKG